MAVRKTLTASGAAVTVALTGNAAGANALSSHDYEHTTLAQKISETFNLNEDEVQKVFDEHRQEIKDTRKQMFNNRLKRLVEEGDLNQEQKQKIKDKLSDLKEERNNMRGNNDIYSREDRRELRHAHRNELNQWAEEYDIPQYLLRPAYHHGRGLSNMQRR